MTTITTTKKRQAEPQEMLKRVRRERVHPMTQQRRYYVATFQGGYRDTPEPGVTRFQWDNGDELTWRHSLDAWSYTDNHGRETAGLVPPQHPLPMIRPYVPAAPRPGHPPPCVGWLYPK